MVFGHNHNHPRLSPEMWWCSPLLRNPEGYGRGRSQSEPKQDCFCSTCSASPFQHTEVKTEGNPHSTKVRLQRNGKYGVQNIGPPRPHKQCLLSLQEAGLGRGAGGMEGEVAKDETGSDPQPRKQGARDPAGRLLPGTARPAPPLPAPSDLDLSLIGLWR